MYIELIDLLRCPREHEESWLVAAFNRMEDRFVIEGRLGCPVCSATYAISNGVADLRDTAAEHFGSSGPVTASRDDDDDETVRIAAMLGLTRPGMVAVIEGADPNLARIVSTMTGAKVVAVNPPGTALVEAENVASVLAGRRLPFGSASIDGLLVNNGGTGHKEILRVLKTGGRVVAPSSASLGGNLRELARDDHYVVAESTGPLLTLTR